MVIRETTSEEETVALGREIGFKLLPPRVVLLHGELGSGKTLLTRGITQGLGLTESTPVRSPTFTLVHHYQTPAATVYHVDLYRLNGLRDLYSIGLEEMLEATAITIIEWAEKLLLPVENPVEVRIQVDHTNGRRLFQTEGIDLEG